MEAALFLHSDLQMRVGIWSKARQDWLGPGEKPAIEVTGARVNREADSRRSAVVNSQFNLISIFEYRFKRSGDASESQVRGQHLRRHGDDAPGIDIWMQSRDALNQDGVG